MTMSNYLNPAGILMFINICHLSIAIRIGRISIIVMNMPERINGIFSYSANLHL